MSSNSGRLQIDSPHDAQNVAIVGQDVRHDIPNDACHHCVIHEGLAHDTTVHDMDNQASETAQPVHLDQTRHEGAFALRSPCHPFYSLPSELILDIIDLLSPEAFINLAFANYPLLQANGLAPALSKGRVQYLTSHTRILSWFPLLKMPAEITLHILHHLKPLDIMRFVVANYQDLARQGIAPPLRMETIRELRRGIGDNVSAT